MAEKKYIIDRDRGGMPKNLTLAEVIIAKNMRNNSYRKKCRIGIMLHLYRNKINPRDYLINIDLDSLKLIAFYFNIVVLEKYKKSTMIDLIEPAIVSKLKLLHHKLEIFYDEFEDGYSLVECIRCKL